MRILIASDIHGSASCVKIIDAKIKEYNPGAVLLLGDILYHGARNPLPSEYSPPEVINILSGIMTPVIAIKGNCDSEVDQMVLPWHLAESAWIAADDYLFLAIHGHQLTDDLSKIKAAAIFSGHTHIPKAEKQGLLHRWNPGSASLPKNGYQPSFGIYDQGQFQVLTFDGQVLMSDRLAN